MGLTLTIDGVDRRLWYESKTLQIHKEGHEERLSLALVVGEITAETWRPANGQEVHITQDGELLFGGLVDSVAEAALAPPNLAGLRWRVTARDWTLTTDVTVVSSLTIPAGTPVMSAAELVRATYLEGRWGIFPNGPTGGGPALPELTFDHVSVRSVFDKFTAETGYFWRINGDRLFAMHAPGSIVGPAFSAANARILNTFEWRKQSLNRYTRLWLAVTLTDALKLETKVGDGARRRFPLDWDVAAPPEQVIEVRGGTGTPYPVPGDRWTFDAREQALIENAAAPVLAVGDELQYSYQRRLPGWVRADDTAALAAGANIVETIVSATDITDTAAAEAEAARQLRLQRRAPREVVLETAAVNVFPDMACTITVAERLVAGSYLVQTVDTSDRGRKLEESEALFSTVVFVEGGEEVPTWLDFWRKKMGSGGWGSVSGGGGGGTPGPPGPAGPGAAMPGHLGGSRSRTRTGTGPVPEWVPVIINRALLSSPALKVRCELAVFAGGGTVTPKLMAYLAGVWTEVGRALVPATGSSASFEYVEFDATAADGAVAYRLDIETSVATASATAIGNVSGA